MTQFDNIVFQLPTPDMLEEIISKVPNIPVETQEYYWLGGYYPQHCVFINSTGDMNDCANDTSRAYCFKVRPVLYFKEDLNFEPGELFVVSRPCIDKNGNKALSARTCVVIDKRRAIVVKPFCPTYHHQDWNAWLNSPSFKHKW